MTANHDQSHAKKLFPRSYQKPSEATRIFIHKYQRTGNRYGQRNSHFIMDRQ